MSAINFHALAEEVVPSHLEGPVSRARIVAFVEAALTKLQAQNEAERDRPKCDDCGFLLVKGELDRSGQSYWCPVCTKADMRMAENKRLRNELAKTGAERDAAVAALERQMMEYFEQDRFR